MLLEEYEYGKLDWKEIVQILSKFIPTTELIESLVSIGTSEKVLDFVRLHAWKVAALHLEDSEKHHDFILKKVFFENNERIRDFLFEILLSTNSKRQLENINYQLMQIVEKATPNQKLNIIKLCFLLYEKSQKESVETSKVFDPFYLFRINLIKSFMFDPYSLDVRVAAKSCFSTISQEQFLKQM